MSFGCKTKTKSQDSGHQCRRHRVLFDVAISKQSSLFFNSTRSSCNLGVRQYRFVVGRHVILLWHMHVVNPFIYALCDRTILEGYKKTFCKCKMFLLQMRKRKTVDEPGNVMNNYPLQNRQQNNQENV